MLGSMISVSLKVDPEDVGVLVVVGVQGKASVQRGYRAQRSKHWLPAADEDLRPPAMDHLCTSRSEPRNEYQPQRSLQISGW